MASSGGGAIARGGMYVKFWHRQVGMPTAEMEPRSVLHAHEWQRARSPYRDQTISHDALEREFIRRRKNHRIAFQFLYKLTPQNIVVHH